MKQGIPEEMTEQMRDIVRRHLKGIHYRFFLFGSRAVGTAQDRSDIDLGIEANRPLKSSEFMAIKEAMGQLPTLLKIDIVDFQEVDATFRNIALKGSELIDER
jgi:predicted nucleotidyltransferase